MRSSRQKLVSVVTIAVLGFVFACASTQETAKGHRHHHHRKHGGGSGKFNIQKIYGEAAVKQCAGNFASPKIEANADKSKVYVISSCCSRITLTAFAGAVTRAGRNRKVLAKRNRIPPPTRMITTVVLLHQPTAKMVELSSCHRASLRVVERCSLEG